MAYPTAAPVYVQGVPSFILVTFLDIVLQTICPNSDPFFPHLPNVTIKVHVTEQLKVTKKVHKFQCLKWKSMSSGNIGRF
jgi:hypothetical protein